MNNSPMISLRATTLLLVLAVPLVAALASPRSTSNAAPRDTALAASRDAGEVRKITSNGGRYVLEVREPEGGFQRGKPLAFDVRVMHAGDPDRALTDVELLVDADMPEHLHGTNRAPRIERAADGSFHVENVYLHMAGWWEVFLDVVEGPWTERAQMRVIIE